MKRNIQLLAVLLVCAVCLCACGEQGALPATTTTTTTTISTTTTATTTAVTTTTTKKPTTTTTKNEKDEFPGVIVNTGGFSYLKRILGLKTTEVIPTEEFLQKYPIALPSGFAKRECYYRLPDEKAPVQAGPEDGCVQCEKKDGTSSLLLYVGKTTYPITNLRYRPGSPRASYVNDKAVTIYQNTADYGFMDVGEFMVTFQKEGFYYRLFATDMTLKELVAVLEELLGGEFSKTTRPTTTTTFYTSETRPFVTTTNVTTTTEVTTTTTATTTTTTTTATTQNEKSQFPGVIVNAGPFYYRTLIPGLKMEYVSAEEFLQKYPIDLPSGFETSNWCHRLPDERAPVEARPEDGYVRLEQEDGTGWLGFYVGQTTYPFTNLQYGAGRARASYIGEKGVTIYQNTADYGFMDVGEFMVTFQKEGFYYRLFATDMTLTELVAVLEELLGGEFSKTTRPTTTTTFYTSETRPTTTTAA